VTPAPTLVPADPASPPPRGGMHPGLLRAIGITAAVTTGLTVWLGLWVTPPSKQQGNLVRLVYLHPPIAWVALYLAFGLAALCSLLYLWPRTRSLFWDRLAAAAVEVGVIFNALTLVTGTLWGRPTWGVWWTWDARLTSTALLLILFLGYLAIRRIGAEPQVRAKRCAVAALVAFVDVPIVHFSVVWWQTLHQNATVLNPNLSPTIHGSLAWTLLLGFVALTLVFVWMVGVRYRIEVLADTVGDEELEVSLTERWAEGTGWPTAEPAPASELPEHQPAGAGAESAFASGPQGTGAPVTSPTGVGS
jgi:heme exporter protein C